MVMEGEMAVEGRKIEMCGHDQLLAPTTFSLPTYSTPSRSAPPFNPVMKSPNRDSTNKEKPRLADIYHLDVRKKYINHHSEVSLVV